MTNDAKKYLNCATKILIYDCKKLELDLIKKNKEGTKDYVAQIDRIITPVLNGFTSCLFDINPDRLYTTTEDSKIVLHDISQADAKELMSSTKLFGGVLNSITFSPKYEFIFASGNEGVKVLDPQTLEVYKVISTRHPVRCA